MTIVWQWIGLNLVDMWMTRTVSGELARIGVREVDKTNKLTNKQANKQTDKHTDRQAIYRASKRTDISASIYSNARYCCYSQLTGFVLQFFCASICLGWRPFARVCFLCKSGGQGNSKPTSRNLGRRPMPPRGYTPVSIRPQGLTPH